MNAIDRKYFFDAVRPMHRDGILKESHVHNYNAIIDYWLLHYSESGTLPQLAYILATVFHETGQRIQPVRETFASSDEQAIHRLRRSRYARVDPVTKQSYYGRGFVQTTWKDNYERVGKFISKQLGRRVDLVNNPGLLLEMDYALPALIDAMYLGYYGDKLTEHVNARTFSFRKARRSVNIMDKADLIAGYANAYLKALRLLPPPTSLGNPPVSPSISDSSGQGGQGGSTDKDATTDPVDPLERILTDDQASLIARSGVRDAPVLTEIPIGIDSLPITPPDLTAPRPLPPSPEPWNPTEVKIPLQDRIGMIFKTITAKTMNAVLLQIARVLVMVTGGSATLTSEDSIWFILGTIAYTLLGLLMPKQNKKAAAEIAETKIDERVG